jgi:hypothetical protein
VLTAAAAAVAAAAVLLLLQGYGFCEFSDGTVVDGVIKSLHNSMVDGRKITVKRADDESAPASVSGSSS